MTLPLICFALGALFAPQLIHQFGLKHTLISVDSLLLLGNMLRPFGQVQLVLGTLMIGIAIAILNVAVPTLIAHFPLSQATHLTSQYAVMMNLVAAIATVLVMPLAQLFNWQTVLGGFGLPALLALLAALLIPQEQSQPVNVVKSPSQSVWSDPVSLRLALFMGLQSLIFYSLIAWLPTLFQAQGASAAEAGTLLSVFQFVGIPAGLLLNHFVNFKRLLLILLLGYLIGELNFGGGQLGWWLAAISLGFTCSLIFSLALTLIATSSDDPEIVTKRSGFAQSAGYGLAAIGPVILGTVHHLSGSWTLVLGLIASLMLVTILVGWVVIDRQ